jgi:LacI family transcriptional regulator
LYILFDINRGRVISTIKDVASAAGVSITTVSHVLNKSRFVSPELSARVLSAVNELGYKPDGLARSLRMKRTHTIGIILPDNANPYFAEVTRGIEDLCFVRGYSAILCNTDNDGKKEALYLDLLCSKGVDGIALITNGNSAAVMKIIREQVKPIVLIDRDFGEDCADTVTVDNMLGVGLAIDHLVELGHRRIGCIAGAFYRGTEAERPQGGRSRYCLRQFSVRGRVCRCKRIDQSAFRPHRAVCL